MMDSKEYITKFIEQALLEDIGDGDHTSLSCIPSHQTGKAKLLVKQPGILAGVEIARLVYQIFDPSLKMDVFITDGTPVKVGEVAFEVTGKEISILQTERLVLNFMQRMSGIATQTHEYVELVAGLNTKILDTRKTTPGMRVFEKMAVKMGGGQNHRMGLYDMILIKDNHVDFAGGIRQAIERVKDYLNEKGKNLDIEIEARTFKEIEDVLSVGGIQRIMIDNFSVEDTRKAVVLIGGRYKTEASGGITKDNLRDYAACGVDFISVGALTHQIKSLDLSLKAVK
ncbi:MAG: nicotinate-nucleotide diphosphorylase (carboxylating) [Bacteroidetes bacterium GWE2_40_63]|jgi:nicotinate-nucleotide pyrophosphorylase (carboxylating)|nr:MAG: nicotinate-nucleotide diphosphorylase (carboxylating) [Bacteroidetes bacterium GWA2_40_14]OFX62440.1 MAG: nicotinate-nucleotide diphosphorylase (carboxylating) [Bacteroidetes bacterium GWC2_40_13]OFX72272.1 MAG: nicotinate-nucleotide diphosphorylase (carboxylating) [Bacteroidetes bacterium GWD2_40_43]OFX90480.1 MAG: nicotinate-nucleotide diphosphorylase (carboxylating) [Bacteroidetes bacterium GWE2_40_63]OFY17274.1 MAG: nicotinate-nucleotide diphosphorylase (carboxylating) [Bacteroidete